MRRFLIVLLCFAVQACGEQANPPATPPSGRPDPNRDASSPLSDGGALAQDASDALSDAAQAAEDAEVTDGQGPTPEVPEAAPPCGTDLTFVGGTVMPDIGAQSGLDGSALDPEKRGPYAVLEQTVKVPLAAEMRSAAGYDIQIEAGEIEGTVYAPSSDQGKTVASGRYPLLVAGPGFGAGYTDYADFFRHFASHGVFVLGINTRSDATVPQHDKEALETSQSITWITEASPYADHLDPKKISVGGHSKGGKVAFFTAAIDARVDIVFGWDPSNAGGPPCNIAASLGLECNALPVAPNCLAQMEDADQAAGVLQYAHAESFVFGVPPDPNTNPTPEHNSLNFYRGALSPASLVYMNGGHAAWLTGGAGALLGDANVIRVTKAVQTAKLLTVFYGATGLARYLPGGDYLDQQGSLIRQVATK